MKFLIPSIFIHIKYIILEILTEIQKKKKKFFLNFKFYFYF